MSACPGIPALVHAVMSGELPLPLGEHVPSCASCRELVQAMTEHLPRARQLDGCDEAEVVLGDIDEGLRDPGQLAALALHARDCSLCSAQLVPAAGGYTRRPTEPPEPEVFALHDDRFELKRQLGVGGMGVVYEAYDRKHNVTIALKTLRALRPQALYRLKNEFRARQDLQHPNLVTLGELIEDHGQWFFTMELVHGVDFLRHVRIAYQGTDARDVTAQWQTDETVDIAPAPRRYHLTEESATPMPPQSPPVDSGAGFDEERLRAALGQLCHALRALHEGGKVHRDVKPSNILVTDEGRVVLLDFGLITDVEPDQAHGDTAGTPAYMAPEQAAGKQVGPAADLYSVGVLLYQALTGQRPFPDDGLGLFLTPRLRPPRRPRELAPAVPPDLDALCMELLAPEPEVRPTSAEVLTRLQGAAPSVWESPTQPGTNNTQTCVGRDRELAELKDALAAVAAGEAMTVLIHGEPGIGKSALIQHFRVWLRKSSADTVVLTGRCYERETVPFKAFDKVIDALSRYLAEREPDEVARLMPADAHVLGRMFPMLGRLTPARVTPAADGLSPLDLRARMFAALRELLGALGSQVALVVVIDDLHWADADSLALLEEILRPPGAPRLLLVASIRDSADEPVTELAARIPGRLHRLPLSRLDHESAMELASLLLSQCALEYPPSAATVAREAGGHPLFIYELVRGAALGETTSTRFESTLWSRIETLDGPARRLLEMTVMANVPMPQGVLGRAAAIDAGMLGRHVDDLRAANLVRAAAQPGWLEPYHERVSSAVLALLDEPARRSCHERLAWALEAAAVETTGERPDPGVLAVHWRGAGDAARASRYSIKAAGQAMRARAFEQAARLYHMAIDLAPEGSSGRPALLGQLGDALSRAGRDREAADALTRAAAGTPAREEAAALRLRAAECLLASGEVDAGVAGLEHVLADLGIPEPGAQRGRLSLAAQRARMALGGVRIRASAELSPEILARLDVAWDACTALGLADVVRATARLEQHLAAALEAGEPTRAARALCLHAAERALRGKSGRRTAGLLDRAERAAGDSGSAAGLVTAARALTALCHGQWDAALDLAREAEARLREITDEPTFALDMTRLCIAGALLHLGRLGELHRLVSRLVREAGDSGSHAWYRCTHLQTGSLIMAWLAVDDVYTARATRAEVARSWPRGSELLVPHLQDLLARHHIDLYVGDGEAAWSDVEHIWPELQRSALMDYPILRVGCVLARARSAVAACHDPADPVLREAARDAGRLAGEKLPHAAALAELVRAGIASRRGDHDRMSSHLGRALRGFEAAGMGLHAAVARRCLGELVSGERGRKLRSGADRWMQAQGIVAPARMSAMLAPGCGDM